MRRAVSEQFLASPIKIIAIIWDLLAAD